MLQEFQENVLKFVCTDKLEGKAYLKYLSAEFFDLAEHQMVHDLIKGYVEKYKVTPRDKANFLEYFDQEAKKQKQPIKDEVYKEIAKVIRALYDPFDADTQIIKDTVLEQAQYKYMKLVIQNYAGKLKDGIEVYRQMQKEIVEIIKLAENDAAEEERNRGGFVLKGHTKYDFKMVQSHPTRFKGLNAMTSSGGFKSPELIIIMGGPKSFKTGTTLSIAMGYVRDGYRVYWADCENGISSIKNRAKMSMMEMSFYDMIDPDHEEILEGMINKFQGLKGDMVVDFYPANTKTLADVNANLEYYREKHNWTPQVIVYDYLDLYLPTDKKIIEKRLKIQAVYHEAIALNNAWDTFAFSPSQVNKQAVNKEVINMKDFSEDFGKAMNCHAAFALCRTEEEVASNIGRLVAVAQRDGKSQQHAHQCFLEIHEDRAFVKEVDPEQAGMQLRRKIDASYPPAFEMD